MAEDNGALFAVLGCSSQGPGTAADNVKNLGFNEWQTSGPVSKSKGEASIDLEFLQPTQIQNIDIGNAGAEFVEVLVSHKPSKEPGVKPPPYQVFFSAWVHSYLLFSRFYLLFSLFCLPKNRRLAQIETVLGSLDLINLRGILHLKK